MTNTATLWTMVSVSTVGKKVVGIGVINNNYMVEQWDVQKAIANRGIIANIEVKSNGDITSSNGSLEKYAHFDAQMGVMTSQNPSAVILNRIERGNKLIGYTVFAPNGCIKKMNIADVVKLHSTVGIANGKLRHTTYGDIISSIKGDYPIMEVDIEKADNGTVKAKVVYFCDINVKGVTRLEYAGIHVTGTSASKISKVMDTIESNNDNLITAVEKIGGKKLADSMRTIRGATSEFFTVISTPMLDRIKDICPLEVHIDDGKKPKTLVSRLIFDAPNEYREIVLGNKNDGVTEQEVSQFNSKVRALSNKYRQ